MAQHDYVIANQGFPAFRSDLNNALAAVVSNNSGATEPTTMFAHQIWVDTAANPSILKIRNADNDAWITIGTINQTGDTFTLTSAVSATTLNTSGAVVFNDAGANVDFRVEGDTDANLLFVDASTDRVGIGIATPSDKLTVRSGTNNVAANVTVGDNLDRISFGWIVDTATINLGQTPAQVLQAGVDLALVARGNFASNMLFYTSSGATAAERARITSDGFFKAKGNETNYINSTGLSHEFISGAGENVVTINRHTAVSPYGTFTNFTGGTPNNTTNYFESYEDTTNLKAILYSNGSWQVRANSYGGISDVKLKQDIVDANSQWDDIKGLRIRKYRFKDEVAADPNYPSHLGVIAQEAEIVSPGLVFESPDFENVEVPVLDDEGNPVLDEEGNPQVTTERQATGTVTKGVKYSILYMKAVKALQEAIERIETLEAKVAALEAK